MKMCMRNQTVKFEGIKLDLSRQEKREWLQVAPGKIQARNEETLLRRSSQALERVAQRGAGVTVPGSVYGKVGPDA